MKNSLDVSANNEVEVTIATEDPSNYKLSAGNESTDAHMHDVDVDYLAYHVVSDGNYAAHLVI